MLHTIFSSGEGDWSGEDSSLHCNCSHHTGVVIERMKRLHSLAVGIGSQLDHSPSVLLRDVDDVILDDSIVVYCRRSTPRNKEA